VQAVTQMGRSRPINDAGENLRIGPRPFEQRGGLKDFAVKVVVDLLEKRAEPVEDVELPAARPPLFSGGAKLVSLDDSAVLGDADKDKPVEQPLDDLIQLPRGQAAVVLVNAPGEPLAPAG